MKYIISASHTDRVREWIETTVFEAVVNPSVTIDATLDVELVDEIEAKLFELAFFGELHPFTS